MRLSKEEYQTEIIKNYFSKKYNNIKITKGEDPPDIYLIYNSKKVAIELTELSENMYRNRIGVSKSYHNFINSKNIKIPEYKNYIVHIYSADIKLEKKYKKEIRSFLENHNDQISKCINGVQIKLEIKNTKIKIGTIICIIIAYDICSKDVASITKSHEGLEFNAIFQKILNKAIEGKKEKCKNVKQPIWLAMHDNFFHPIWSIDKNESAKKYYSCMEDVDFGIFEKILITFGEENIEIFDNQNTKL